MNKKIVLMAVLAFTFSAMLAGQVVTPARAEETTTFPDLEPVFMLFDPPFPSVNENVMIVAQMLNNGTADAFGVKVSFFANSSYIGYNTTSVLAGFLNETSISWTPASLGNYNITAVVDPLDEVAESNETNNVLSEFPLVESEWLVEGTGTRFEITNSEYLNITLTSSETVRVILESVPRMINFVVERNSSATSTVLTLSGFEPDTTHYRYQDGDLMANFTSDSEGGYTYTQDISEPHHVFIQEETSTLYIGSNYTFTSDIYEAIVITANNTVIDGNGFTLQCPGSGDGFYLNRRSGVTIKNVVVKGWGSGIYLYESSGNTISGNNINNNGWGIRLWWSDGNNITGNNINNNEYGIRQWESDGNNITGNNINNNNRYGLWLEPSDSNNISGNNINNNGWVAMTVQNSTGNTVSGNTVNSWRAINVGWSDGNNITGNNIGNTTQYIQNGFRLFESDGNNITGNNINNNYWGIILWWCDGNNITGNNITNTYCGILLGDFSWCDNTISGNTINNNQYGIWLLLASGDNVSGNTVTNSWWDGIRLWNSTGINILGNTIQNSGELGISLWWSNSNRVSGNTIQNNSAGIMLQRSTGNDVSGNTIQNSGWGIQLRWSNGDNVSGNTINNTTWGIILWWCDGDNVSGNTIQNSGWGIWLRESSGNTVYHNNIINNGRQAYDTNPAANDWHHPDLLEGNYWSNYPGVDDGSGTGKHAIAGDGIGDTRIPWPEPNYDYYPFIHESGWILHPAIEVTKTADKTMAHVGDIITYTVTVSNPSADTTMYKVSVVDSLLGTISADFSASLVAGASETKTYTHTVASDDADPLANTVTVTYKDALDTEKTATASWSVDVLHPGIHVTKTGPTYAYEGDTITYTITVNNTGNCPLYSVSVTDTLLGTIYSDGLAFGETKAFTKTYTIPSFSGDITNTVTAVGSDALGRQVSDKASWTVHDVPRSRVTDSRLYYFDMDSAISGQQFRLIFTQDVNNPSTYKLPASNPGQFYYNVFYIGTPGSTVSLQISIPSPFVIQGAVPIHVYGSVSTMGGCFVPSNELSGFSISGTSTITVSGQVPGSGLVYVTAHLDYGLKGTSSYGKSSTYNAMLPGPDGISGTADDIIAIQNLGNYAFSYSVSGSLIDSQTIQNENAFKKDPGFAGLILDSQGNPVKGVKVQIYDSNGKLLATVYTDEDGWYFYSYKQTGKAATYTLKLPAYNKQQSVLMKANSLVEVDFTI